MTLPLPIIQIIQELSQHLYNFLPGTPHPFADQSLSFRGIAYALGLNNFWLNVSKLRAISFLLENTFDKQKGKFCDLILEIVKRGIQYRQSKYNPINRQEIEKLNEFLLKLGFKIPELWDKKFLKNLPSSVSSDTLIEEEQIKIDEDTRRELAKELIEIGNLPPQERGFAFERFLTKLFSIFNLKPRGSFRLSGEQIDGSLELDGETYLIEAKWENHLVGLKELLAFYEKIEGKAKLTRGIFISYSGFTKEAIESFSKGRPTNLLVLTGQDLYFVLNGINGEFLNLDQAIRLKVRYAAETGDIRVTIYQLLAHKVK
jgi:hypothetical protein